jgi:hypothetical protein
MAKKSKAPKKAAPKASTTSRTKADLKADLSTQYHFLRKSATDFDQGAHREALRLAVSMRVLIHETSQSHSLLNQCGLDTSLRFIDTHGHQPKGMFSIGGIVWMVLAAPPRWMAPLAKASVAARLPLDQWWSAPVIRITRPNSRDSVDLTRKILVLALANQDGGAHVDPDPESTYYALTRDSLVGEVAIGGKPVKWDSNPVPHVVRQVAYEVMTTLEEQAATEIA